MTDCISILDGKFKVYRMYQKAVFYKVFYRALQIVVYEVYVG